MIDLIGKTFSRYKIVRKIGTGATAMVYLGEHLDMGRRAAVKVLHPHLSANAENIERFRREAQAISSLDHGNIVKIYDFVAEPQGAYIVFEYVEGSTLRGVMEKTPDLPPELAVAVIREVAGAVKAAHAVNIIHRDIKPENILITPDGRVKLTDFGIARLVGMENMTLTGALMGSPNYMSPEQVEGGEVTAASDIFSLGVLFYFLLTRKLPFEAKTHARTIKNILAGEFVPPETHHPRVNVLASRLVEKCLRKEAAERFQSVDGFLESLSVLEKAFGLAGRTDILQHCFLDREAFLAHFNQDLVKSLITFAKSEFAAGRQARALACLNHALCVDPRNAEVNALLSRSRRRRRVGKAFAFILLLGLLAAVAAVFYMQIPRGKNPASPPPAAADTVAAAPETIQTMPSADTVPVTPKPRVRPALPVKTVKVPAVKARTDTPVPAAVQEVPDTAATPEEPRVLYGTLKFYTKPWAKVYIDDVYKGKTPFVGEAVVPAGRHEIRLENPYCIDLADTVEIIPETTMVKRYTLDQKAGP
jgi:serine/threonine-protein kinase